MKKLAAVLVLSIVMTGMAAVPAEPLEPPMVSVGEQSEGAVAVATPTSALILDSHALVTMEQSDVMIIYSAVATPATPGVPTSGALTSGCDLQRGTNSPLMDADQYITDGEAILKIGRSVTSMEKYVPGVAGLTPSRRQVLLLQ